MRQPKSSTSRSDLIRAEAATLANQEQAVLLLSKAKVYLDEAKEVKALVEDAILAFIEEHGSFEVGEVRYYAGDTKKTTILDPEKLLEALLIAHNGDLSEVVKCFAKNFAKVGECSQSVDRDEHFKTEAVPKLKEGKPKKRLLTAEAKYVK